MPIEPNPQNSYRRLSGKAQNLSRYPRKSAPNAVKNSKLHSVVTAMLFSQFDRGRSALFFNSRLIGKKARGSLTLEAAFVLPLFLFFMTVFLRFTVWIGFQMRLQAALESAVCEASLISGAGGVNSLIEARWKVLLAREMALAELGEEVQLVEGGAAGLDFSASDLDVERQWLTLQADYQVSFLTGLPLPFRLYGSQRSSHRLWTGSEGTKWEVSAPEEETEDTVYITENGRVYHYYADCTYLQPSVRKVSSTVLGSLRSQDGSIYYACEYCGRAAAGGQVYVTDYGDRYHTTLSCSRISRNVKAIKLSEAGSRPACSKCRGRKEKGK